MTDPQDEIDLEEDDEDEDEEEDEYDGPTFCPEHGWDVQIDEDGDCVTCGNMAIGTAVDALALFLEDLENKSHELCHSVFRVRDLVSASFELVDEDDLTDKPMADA